MIALRRTTPLLVLLGLGLASLIARLWQTQIVQHELWADEAANMLRSGALLPYKRGTIRDASGRVLAEDRENYRLVLRYRDFRRGHPLGAVTHALSSLLGKPIRLSEAEPHLLDAAAELVHLEPLDLERFARGGQLQLSSGVGVPALSTESGDEQRAARAADLSFYIGVLLGFSEEERKFFSRLASEKQLDDLPSYLELLADRRGELPAVLEQELAAGWQESREDLKRLAVDLAQERASQDRAPGLGQAPPADELAFASFLLELEALRRSVEDLTASSLFRTVAEVSAGRFEPGALVGSIDLGWLAALLRWDTPRLLEWAQSARLRWLERWRQPFVQRVADELSQVRADADGKLVERVLDLCLALYQDEAQQEAALHGQPASWRASDAPLVLGELGALFPEAAVELETPALAFQSDALRKRPLLPGTLEDWELLELAGGPGAPSGLEWATAFGAGQSKRAQALEPLVLRLLEALEAQYQAALGAALDACRAAGDAPGERALLSFSAEGRERAREPADFALKDYGSRPVGIADHPGYELVYLVTRYPERYAGFEAERTSERVLVRLPEEEGTPAALLLGSARTALNLAGEAQASEQQTRMRELVELRRKAQRSAAEEQQLGLLLDDVLLSTELAGVRGIESSWNAQLSGRNGYEERTGLEELYGQASRTRVLRLPEDGLDLELTLRSSLQLACERALEFPRAGPDALEVDSDWMQHPVGALVLLAPNGDVLAAASAPTAWSVRDLEAPTARTQQLERCFHRPQFQPPGSVFKPFVALYALEKLGLDPHAYGACVPQDGGPAGFADVRCSVSAGHGAQIDLQHALRVSCNSYFAWVGQRYDAQHFRELAASFGFGERTGAFPDNQAGRGAEDLPLVFPQQRSSKAGQSPKWLGQSANGLTTIEATPAQVARAYCAIATGVLPSLRLVRGIGGQEAVPGAALPLPYSAANLEQIRSALHAVANQSGGSAYKALNAEELGFEVCAKTGSADIESRVEGDSSPRRKHAWVAGWAPAERPQVIFALVLLDVRPTASRSAVWVMQSVLQDPAVAAYITASASPVPPGPQGGH